MYLVKFTWQTKGCDTHTFVWEESFPTLQDAVRFGMRKYRIWDEVKSFRAIKLPKRDSYTLKYW